MSIFNPSMDKNPERAVKAIAKITDQKKLADIALHAPCKEARSAAVAALSDEKALAQAAHQESDETLRCEAVDKLTDWLELEYLAKNDRSPTVRLHASRRLAEPGSLYRVATESKYDDALLFAELCNRLTDEKTLDKIASCAKMNSARCAAVRCIKDQALLKNRALASNGDVSRAAIETLTDQNALAEIALKSQAYEDLCLAAVERINDPLALAKIAANGRKLPIVQAAVRKLTDRKGLLAFAVSYSGDRDWAKNVILPFLEQTDQATLVQIACAAEAPFVRAECATRLNDPAALMKFALSIPDYNFRGKERTVIESFLEHADPAALAQVARDAIAPSVRGCCALLLPDSADLMSYVLSIPDYAIGDKERNRVETFLDTADQAARAQVARSAKNPLIRACAVDLLTEQDTLFEIAMHDDDLERVFSAAIVRLTEPERIRSATERLIANIEDADARYALRYLYQTSALRPYLAPANGKHYASNHMHFDIPAGAICASSPPIPMKCLRKPLRSKRSANRILHIQNRRPLWKAGFTRSIPRLPTSFA